MTTLSLSSHSSVVAVSVAILLTLVGLVAASADDCIVLGDEPASITVVNIASSDYELTVGTTKHFNPTLQATVGVEYKFTLDTLDYHPFWLKYKRQIGKEEGLDTIPESTSHYTGVMTWTPSEAELGKVFYICENHSAMSGEIYVVPAGTQTECVTPPAPTPTPSPTPTPVPSPQPSSSTPSSSPSECQNAIGGALACYVAGAGSAITLNCAGDPSADILSALDAVCLCNANINSACSSSDDDMALAASTISLSAGYIAEFGGSACSCDNKGECDPSAPVASQCANVECASTVGTATTCLAQAFSDGDDTAACACLVPVKASSDCTCSDVEPITTILTDESLYCNTAGPTPGPTTDTTSNSQSTASTVAVSVALLLVALAL
eukprot:TRINITY_DN3558_c0_g2_i1.p1 TRINITY_DN3558_c0_g2~~TRINITY_DN3558_c0_g2_i1.p1  ORF type:complete len:381 (+),score=69.98 TRINITY_DN3558_c0_g2_i1:2-1144(+)